MKPEIEELRIVRATTSWMKEAVEIAKKEPAIKYKKLPALSVQADVAVAVKCISEPRETTKQGKDYAWLDVELIEPAIVYTKEEGEFEAVKGTEASMNLKRHAGLFRNFKRMFPEGKPCVGVEIVIANLGKRKFETEEYGWVSGYDYRIMKLADIKAKMKKK